MTCTDVELFEKYLDGDEVAFSIFYARHSFDLWRLIISVVRDIEAADDVMQETFLLLHARRSTQIKGRDPRAFVLKIGFNAALMHRRETERLRSSIPCTPLWDGSGQLCDVEGNNTVGQEMAVEDERMKVASILDGLQERYRQILLQYYVEGMSYRELAEKWDVAVGTVSNRLKRAIDEFKLVYDGRLGVE